MMFSVARFGGVGKVDHRVNATQDSQDDEIKVG